MFRWMPIAGLLLASAAQAQVYRHVEPPAETQIYRDAKSVDEPTKSSPPQRIRNVLVFGEQKCPVAASSDEIVVCSRGGDSPYRIPKKLRETPYTPDGVAWGRRAEILEEVNRVGLPNSCSTVGTGGQTGCTAQLMRQWAEEQIAKKDAQAKIP